MDLLTVENLSIAFKTDRGLLRAVEGFDFTVQRGKTLAVVGESGCGKSVTALAIMGLLPEQGRVEKGSIRFDGITLNTLSSREMRGLRGNRIAMVFQEPMTALNPVLTVGQQIAEVFKIHTDWSAAKRFAEGVEMLARVRIPDPERRMYEYPFQMSGGMRQRVLIAIALACKPDLLIADEPTTALDVTIQAQILKLIRELQNDLGTSVIYITHDLGVVAEVADDVMVMYAGKAVERGNVYDIFARPSHPYTRGLLASIPSFSKQPKSRLASIPGLVPSLHELPSGCRFRNRCNYATAVCAEAFPPWSSIETSEKAHTVSCYRWQEIS